MLRLQTRFTVWCGVCVVLVTASQAHAQLFGNGCDCAQTRAVSVSTTASAVNCQTVMQPVVQSCYQPVTMTEYHPVTQTVRRPKVEARVVNQDVIEYVPVTEQRTAQVPVTSYQDVTEYQQVARNAGFWQTHVQQNYRPSPCEYDNRRTAVGWMNRSAYEFRSLFVPQQTVRHEFVPQTVVQTVPVTRRVAVQCSKQVSYNVTRMVAQRSTRQVAVNHVSYEDVQTTTMVPRTVVRHVPIGTQTAYSPLGTGQITLQPTPESQQTVIRPQQNRSATNRSNNDAFEGSDPDKDRSVAPKGALNQRSSKDSSTLQASDQEVKTSVKDQAVAFRRSSPPSMVRLNKWVARTPTPPEGPTSDMSVADVHR